MELLELEEIIKSYFTPHDYYTKLAKAIAEEIYNKTHKKAEN